MERARADPPASQDSVRVSTRTTRQSSASANHTLPSPLRFLSSSTQFSPTRILRWTEEENRLREAAANSQPTVLIYEEIERRPRSNPRNRTPNRYESPLDPEAFRRRETEAQRGDEDAVTGNANRITIRSTAGIGVGHGAPIRIREERTGRTPPPKSRKQGPGRRKERRWNNSHFGHLAAEIATSSRATAEALSAAFANAHLHRSIYDAKEHECEAMQRFMKDDANYFLRERFLYGEVAVIAQASPVQAKEAVCAADCMLRIEKRLRRIIVKACTAADAPAAKVMAAFEDFLVATTRGKHPKNLDESWWKNLLVDAPVVVHEQVDVNGEASNGGTTIHFAFNGESPTGGFHRLLLHAIAQFHGLQATSRLQGRLAGNGSGGTVRALLVKGKVSAKLRHLRLVPYLLQRTADRGDAAKSADAEFMHVRSVSISNDGWELVSKTS